MSRYPKGYRKPTDSCDGCLAWGDFSGRLCPACYMFGRSHATAVCDGCRRPGRGGGRLQSHAPALPSALEDFIERVVPILRSKGGLRS